MSSHPICTDVGESIIIDFISEASESIHHPTFFRFQELVNMYQRMFPSLKVDFDSELLRYKEYAERIRPLVRDTVSYLDKSIRTGKKVLVEGANAAMLDIDFGKLFFFFFFNLMQCVIVSILFIKLSQFYI